MKGCPKCGYAAGPEQAPELDLGAELGAEGEGEGAGAPDFSESGAKDSVLEELIALMEKKEAGRFAPPA